MNQSSRNMHGQPAKPAVTFRDQPKALYGQLLNQFLNSLDPFQRAIFFLSVTPRPRKRLERALTKLVVLPPAAISLACPGLFPPSRGSFPPSAAPLVTTTCISRDGRSLTYGHTRAYSSCPQIQWLTAPRCRCRILSHERS